MAIEVPLTSAKEGGEEGEEGEEGDSVLGFLLKLQKEQELMKGYVHAPFRDVVDGLDDNNNSNERNADAKTTLSISRRQIFNWLPPPPSSSSPPFSHHHLSKIQQISRTDCGLLWNFLQLLPTSTSPKTKNHNNNNHNTNTDSDGVEICIMPS